MENQFKHSKGRPPQGEQLNIERQLRPYFENSISATLTSQKTGFNIKTVLKYFNKWKKEILDNEDSSFIQRCKEEKERCLLTLENKICSLEEDKTEIELLIKAAKKAGDLKSISRFYKIKLAIIEKIGRFVSARINLVNAATVDAMIDFEKNEKGTDSK